MDPLQLEQHFQVLVQQLPLLASRRLKLQKIMEFQDAFPESEDGTYLAAYVPELRDIFLRTLSVTDFTGTLPSFLRRVRSVLTRWQRRFPEWAKEPEWRVAVAHLNAEQEQLGALLARKLTGAETLASQMDAAPAPTASDGSRAYFPVVEREPIITCQDADFAAVRSVRVELQVSRKQGEEDDVHIDQVFDADGVQHRQMRQALAVARRLLKSFAGITDKRRLIVHCSFDEPNVMLGESLGAALTFAVFSEFLHLHQHRELVLLRADVALTGVTDADGRFHPVEDRGLQQKVQACACSWIRFLVVPREQEAAARAALAGLQSEPDPKPTVSIVGVSDLDEIVVDRRLTIVRRLPWSVHIARRAWRRRRPIVIGMITLLLAAVARLWYGPLDREPASLELSSQWVQVLNRGGDLLERIWVGPWVAQQEARAREEERGIELAMLIDVDGDGRKEVLYVDEASGEDAGSGELCCKRVGDSRPLWTYRIKKEIALPGAAGIADSRFRILGFQVDDLERNESPKLVLLGIHSSLYPSVVAMVVPASGQELSSYVHYGMLSDVRAVDVDGDSVKEIVACGVNNLYRMAALVVLDPRRFHGASPVPHGVRENGIPSGSEEYYILIPRTMVGNVYRSQSLANVAIRVGNPNGRRELTLTVRDFEGYVPELGREVEGLIMYHFSPTFSLIRMEEQELFNLTAEMLFRKGKVPRMFDASYVEIYREGIQYWDGRQWQRHPARNPRF